jgi:hypothetical protein
MAPSRSWLKVQIERTRLSVHERDRCINPFAPSRCEDFERPGRTIRLQEIESRNLPLCKVIHIANPEIDETRNMDSISTALQDNVTEALNVSATN